MGAPPPLAMSLRGFGVTFGATVVIARVDLDLPVTGMTVLVGPTGSGKSTLVRTLAGLNDAHPALGTWGEVTMRAPPALVGQHARFFIDTPREHLVSALPARARLTRPEQHAAIAARLAAEGLACLAPVLDREAHELELVDQRRLALARALIADPAILMTDELTDGLDGAGGDALIELLRVQATRRSLLMVTHNQTHARRAGGTTVLLGGGRVVATAPTERFFTDDADPLVATFVRTGGLPLAGPSADPANLADDLDEANRPVAIPADGQAVVAARSRFGGPRGFYWATPNLAGVPRPGVVDDLDRDLEGLERMGITVLITLEETRTVPAEAGARRGIAVEHFPIVDMEVPTLDAMVALCTDVAAKLRAGHTVAVHCRAGLGRTGTVLAAYLIAAGATAAAALAQIRAIQPGAVQSAAQARFLADFASAHRGAVNGATD